MSRLARRSFFFALCASCASAPPPRAPPPREVRAPPPPRPVDPNAGPQPMPVEEFRHFIAALDREPGDAAKLAMVKTAAADNYFLAGEVGMIIDHLTYRQSKLDVVPILNPRITDRSESWKLVEKFTYREDKAQVQQELSQH